MVKKENARMSMTNQNGKVNGSRVKVSVVMITYNHEKYIAQAIESVLMQETSFNFEVVIGEDCSTDRTREIVIEYQKKFPDKIRLLLQDKNLGANANYRQTYSACNGEYIAYLEGDDYWIDRKKLQKQVAFLEKNTEFSMCFTGARKIDEKGTLLDENMVAQQFRKSHSQKDLIRGYVPPSLTVMVRQYHLKYPKCCHKIVNLDYFECAMLAENGDVGYLPDITACFRMHSGGIWSLKDQEYHTVCDLELSEALLKHFGWKYRSMLLSKVRWAYGNLIRLYIRDRKIGKLLFTCLRLFNYSIAYELGYRTAWRLEKFRLGSLRQ